MTYIDFINCLALTFVPYFIVYKTTKLSTYRALSLCIWGGAAYLLTELVKMILIATFIPTSEDAQYDFTQELGKAVIGFLDIAGLYAILNYKGGDKDVRVLAIGLGWAAAESIVTRFAPLWIGARGLEFDWRYIQMGLEANIRLPLFIAFSALVLLWSQKKLDRERAKYVLVALLVFPLIPVITGYLQHKVGVGSWVVLGVQAAIVALLALSARHLYALITTTKRE